MKTFIAFLTLTTLLLSACNNATVKTESLENSEVSDTQNAVAQKEADKPTTIYMVRHAEKVDEDNPDPTLTTSPPR